MILTDKKIKDAKAKGDLLISPFSLEQVNANSYDVRLGNEVTVYGKKKGFFSQMYYNLISLFREVNPVERIDLAKELDCRAMTETVSIHIPEDGLVLEKFVGYLGSTLEYTENPKYVPVIYGKSSLGRNFLLVHFTAGFGDIGFNGHWTLELMAANRLRIYANMKIGQIVYFNADGKVDSSYSEKNSSKYKNQSNKPTASKYHENFK